MSTLSKIAPSVGGAMAVVAVVGAWGPAVAHADGADRFDRLARLRSDVERARGPGAYAALRQLWQEWDQGDPALLEEILHGASADTASSPPIRVYAGLLEAYARRRRGDLEGARTRIARLGFVDRWLVVGPFDNEGKAGFDRVLGPEEERLLPLVLGRAYDGKERPVRWRSQPPVSPFGWVDFGSLFRPTEKTCAYATTFVRSKATKPPQSISLWAGSAGALKVFWNGVEVIRDEKYRDLDAERFAARVPFLAGDNRLLVKVCGDEEAPLFTLRLASEDGSPNAELEAAAEPARSAEAKAPAKLPPPRIAMTGPLPELERLAAGNDPAKLEALARYLVATQSDDPSEKRARELMRRAAEKQPTVDRLLFAGELAEDRNQRATWIERAEAQVRSGKATRDERIDTLLARASHARSGMNWRDAVPTFEKVLALDPDNVAAQLARVELFSEAGLRDTALAFLERALARRPRSVALLRAMTLALREQDRTTEADEMQERYAQLRFDDPTFVRTHIELAVARRDEKTARRWTERMVATNPDSSNGLSFAARTLLALGDRPGAIALYRRALDLAPEDTDTLRALADVYAITGKTDEQLTLLRKVLEIQPQAKDVREYVAHTEPSKPRADEAYARPASEFLKLRDRPSAGLRKRTFIDLQVTTVFPNGLASRFHQVVFQPLTDSAAAEAREYAFGFEASTETVQLRGARVYRKGGQVDDAIESGEGPADNPALATYTSARAYYVHFPRLAPGDVVELLYRVEDVAPRNAFADYFGEVVYLQDSQPIARAEYVLITPKSRTFYFNKPNVAHLKQSVDEKGASRIYRFVAEDVPPIDPEPLQPPFTELLGHVHVSTYQSWDEMGRWYWGLAKDQFVADDEVKRRVAEITQGITDNRAKVRAVYDWVVQRTRYVALEFGIHGFKPYRCAQIFARGFGDCKDKATLIVTMLKELGIPATIVIVRTGHRGDFETEPASLAPFDHAIAYVPSMDLYLDGTAEFTGSTELPAMDRNSLALQVNEGKPRLVRLPDPPASESVMTRKLEATVSADGSAQIEWRAEVTGAAASAWRQRYHAAATQKQRLLEDIGPEMPGLTISSVDTSELDDIERPVELTVHGKLPELGRREGAALSVPVGPREHFVRDYTSLSSRKLDLRLPPKATTNEWHTIVVPPGWKVTRLPKSQQLTSPFGRFGVEASQTGNTVLVKTQIVMDRSRITASEYPAFRNWCETVDHGLGQRITLTK